MAHKKAGGSAATNRDSNSKRLGVKMFGGEMAQNGNIIIRQKGTKYHPGVGVKLGNDFTIYAVTSGKVKFTQKLGKRVVNIEQV